ncbi:MAG: hypothetical protein IT384_16695 [Deltaproteobacteria bacterium]|nr:hypothetical protein [Deltaproteobacteria bacterium]
MGREEDTGDTDRFALSRRRLLKLALGGGLVLAGAGAAVRSLLGPTPVAAGLRSLTPREHRTLAALARTHLPRGGAFEAGAEDFDLATAFDGFLENEAPENVRDLKRALLLVELGPLLFDHRWVTFSRLEDRERLTHWQAWIASDRLLRRQVSLAFRKFMALVFFDRPEVWPHIGYGGPSFAP